MRPALPLSPSPAVSGLLVSQIGYDPALPRRAIVRGPAGHLSPRASFIVHDHTGAPRLDGLFSAWGEQWGSHWWIADLAPLTDSGRYRLTIQDSGCPALASDEFLIEPHVLRSRTWAPVAIDQAERRQRIANDKLGWYDAGTHWQEANSHAAYLFGLADSLERDASRISDSQRTRLIEQIVSGANYLGVLQDLATQKGWSDGTLVHQSFKYDQLLVPGDVAKAAAAWARVAHVLPDSTHARERADYRSRARRAIDYLSRNEPTPHLSFNFRAHGAPKDVDLPPEPSTPTLQMWLWATVELARDTPADIELRTRAFALANRLLARQATPAQAQDGLHGFFHLYDRSTFATKAWAHGMTFDDPRMSADIGCTFGLNLWPLFTLLETWPDAPDAPRWRAAIEHFAYGYFLPGCQRNPFLITPNGLFPGEGLIWFAGLWHGANAIYGLAAAQALEFARRFNDQTFLAVAAGNLQWIAGLNAGLTREALGSTYMFSMDVPPNVALPVSMINGVGGRDAGTWLNIRGSICNGFGTGEQFVWDIEPRRAHDGPHAFTDEDWITHAGAWLMALARL